MRIDFVFVDTENGVVAINPEHVVSIYKNADGKAEIETLVDTMSSMLTIEQAITLFSPVQIAGCR